MKEYKAIGEISEDQALALLEQGHIDKSMLADKIKRERMRMLQKGDPLPVLLEELVNAVERGEITDALELEFIARLVVAYGASAATG